MTQSQTSPPRWAEALLRSLLRPSDRESISGDLLEEYRLARRPAVGAIRANAWYVRTVLSVLWRLIWPYALALGVQGLLLAVTVFRPGHHAPGFRPEASHARVAITAVRVALFGNVVPVPGVSLLDGLIYLAVAFRCVQRSRLIRTGLITAVVTGLVGFAMLFVTAAAITPDLMRAPFENPFILVILSVYLLVPVGFAGLVGSVAGVIVKVILPPPAPRKRYAS